MPDYRRARVSGSFKKCERRHRIEHTFAEIVGRAIVDPRDADALFRQLESQPRIKTPWPGDTANRTADAYRRSPRLRRGMEDHRDRPASSLDIQRTRPLDFGARLDTNNSQAEIFGHLISDRLKVAVPAPLLRRASACRSE